MNTIAFYICLGFYIYHNLLIGNTDMKLISFQSSVLVGIMAILNRR